MRHEKLFEPIDGPNPCGPDLDEEGDDQYLNYILPAEERLPVRFFDKDSGAPPDRAAIDLKTEVKTISGLLEKSRDLRLLTLEARFQILAGQIPGFSESIQAIAGLVSRFWQDVHPKPWEGDYTMRQNILSALDDRGKIILPLQYAPIVRDKRLGNLSYRQYAVASGSAKARENETAPDAGAIKDALANLENRPVVEEVHSSLLAARESLSLIRASFIEGAGYENAPSFDGLREAIDQIAGLIESSIPDLAAGQGEGQEKDAPLHADMEASAGQVLSGAAPDSARLIVGSQAEASAALLAAEMYFAQYEPSAPALILVHQARMLIGQPLVAVIEALSPENADQALIRLEGGLKIQLDMARMRSLTERIKSGEPNGADQAGAVREFTATSRSEAAALITGVEDYFRAAEPSSPVSTLLKKSLSYSNRDFPSILKDLLGRDEKAT